MADGMLASPGISVYLCALHRYYETRLKKCSVKRIRYCYTYTLHLALRTPLLKTNAKHQLDINELLECIKHICERTSPSACNSAKYHLPYHWLDTRLQLGCSAAEKSLERKLGEAKRNISHSQMENKTGPRYSVCITFVRFTCTIPMYFEKCTYTM